FNFRCMPGQDLQLKVEYPSVYDADQRFIRRYHLTRMNKDFIYYSLNRGNNINITLKVTPLSQCMHINAPHFKFLLQALITRFQNSKFRFSFFKYYRRGST